MQVVPLVAIGVSVVAVSWPVSAEAMQGVVVQPETMRANVAAADVTDTNPITEASDVFAGTHAADMATAAKASDVTSAAKAAAHMAAATAKTSAVTATTTATTATAARVGRAHQQARSEKRCCQYRHHPFHRDTPFQSDCSAP
jgi:hypothetical protein